jgi:RHS repeat-associated protein
MAAGSGEICGNELDDDSDGEPDCSDPDCLALAPNPSQPRAFSDTVAWLYEPQGGSRCAALQEGVQDGALVAGLVSVVRGRVSDIEGQPLGGAEIRVVGAPELGRGRSRGDGMFDMAVNGGRQVTLAISAEGYLPVHRRAVAPVNDFAWVEPVALKARSAVATRVDLSGGGGLQVMRAEASEDASGRREPALLFPPGTRATVDLAEGGEMPLDSLNVRLTEFTVGERGPEAMPADLPVTSGYTYAFELSVDEADALGARGVRFDQALPVYLENFLGFPAGTPVPVGYYDREAGIWRGESDGVVIAIVGETDGLADIDLDGDAAPNGVAELQAAGIAEDERRRLAELYEPGQSLWRVGVNHFSAYDFNWAFGFPSDAASPPILDLPGALTDTPGCASGSILRVDNRTLGESIGVAGTGYDLFYQSDRAAGGQPRSIDVEVSGAEVPASLKHIEAVLDIAGQRHELQIDPAPLARFQYAWDGLNAYGRPIQGAQKYRLRIGYVYDGVYASSERADGASFAQPPSVELTGSKTREEVSTVREVQGSLGGWDARGNSLGGFSLDVHHTYDPPGRTLYYGDGRQRSAETVPPIVTDVFPGSDLEPQEPLALGDGSLLFAGGDVLYRFADGQISPFAGGGTPADGLGDGGAALGAALANPRNLALAPDGSIYFWSGARIRRVDPAGQISSVLGGGTDIQLTEGALAGAVDPVTPAGLAVSPEGIVYFSEFAIGRVYFITADGRVGHAPKGPGMTFDPFGLEFGPDGSLYIAGSFNTVKRMDADGIVSTLAGQGIDFGTSTGDGGLAKDATIDGPSDVAFDQLGNMYVAEGSGLGVRMVTPDGLIEMLARMSRARDISVGPDGTIYVGAGGYVGPNGTVSRDSVYKITPSLPGAALDDFLIAAEDGSEVYRFDPQGRHLATVDALTGLELRRFEYDTDGRLTALVEENLRRTAIERDGSGNPSAIVSPYGVRTELVTNADGYLERVTDAAGQSVALEYAAGGLLTALVDERGGRHEYAYDGNGRLVSDRDPSGAAQLLEASTDGESVTVTRTTPLGRATRHERVPTEAGVEQRVVTPGGATRTSLRDAAGNLTATSADGTTIATIIGADPRFGSIAPISAETRITLPSGLESVVRQALVTELANLADPLSLTRFQHETDTNGRVSTSEYDAAARTFVQRSPEGREVTRVLDVQGRLSETRIPGLLPTFYEYDVDGRLVATSSGEGADLRRVTIEHTAEGWVSTVTDSLGQATLYTVDPIGRTLSTLYADGTSASFAYDAASNLTTLTPPGQVEHGLEYDARNLVTAYRPPELPSGATSISYVYDADQALTTLSLAGVDPITYGYTPAGLLSTVQHGGGNITLTYDAAERLASSQSPDGITVAYEYDGALPTATVWSGAIAGNVSQTYDENLFIAELSVNGTSIAYEHDGDGLLTQAGALALSHDPTNALLTATSLGDLETVHGYSPRGELISHAVTGDAGALYDATHTYDALGRIATTSETVDGVTTTTGYAYDAVGQLVEVTTNGVVSAAYGYDDDGNRSSAQTDAETANATYDAQERLLTYGDATYAYTPRGTLEGRTAAGVTTSYTYDALGNLTAVSLSDGRDVSYLSDAENRRVGRRVDGALERGWLYQNALKPIAELDATGTVVSRFVYATKAIVPDFMLRDGVTYGFVTDLRGSVRLVVNTATSEVVQRIDYGPFGEVVADSNPGFQPFGFAGGLYDADTGLVRFGARDYDPVVGRWLAKDPIGFGGGQGNLYGYVANDPVNLVDPSGEVANLLLQGVIGGLAGGALEAGIQYAANGCVDWGSVGTAAAVGALTGVGIGGAAKIIGGLRGAARGINAVPTRVARVVPAEFAGTRTLGAHGAGDAFVTAADDIAGIGSSGGLAQRLTLVDKAGNMVPGARAIIEFDTPLGLASPVFRTNPGFIGRGFTSGGAREFVLPNLNISELGNVTVRIVP